MSGNYQAADANALQVPATATDAGVLQCLGEIKSLLVTMNHNLATVITQHNQFGCFNDQNDG
ncbi:hypothetical protein RSAG8_12817, partial [Rhizoctonia solani AG-8 WAC10335]